MPNYLSTNPRYFCRNVQYFSEFYSNLSFSLFFLSFELLQSSRFRQNLFVVCKCLQRVILCKHLCFRAKASDSPPLSTAERQDHPWFSFGTIFRQVRSLQAQGASRMLSAFFQRSALHLLLYDMTAQIVPPCSTLPLSAALFGCFPSPQMQGAEGCSLSFQKIAGSTTRHPEEASAFPDILQHTKTAPASCFGNRGGSFALWFFILRFSSARTVTCGDS